MPLSSTIYVLAIPFFMFLFLGLVGVKMPRKVTGVIGVLAMAVTTVLAYAIALTYFYGTGQGQVVDGVRQQIVTTDWSWLSFYADKLVVRLGILLDPISAMMLIVICTVSFMVHLYSLGYMSDHEGNPEKGFQRYYADLALFTFSMLGLVVSTNIFQMFIFFEMVFRPICSLVSTMVSNLPTMLRRRRLSSLVLPTCSSSLVSSSSRSIPTLSTSSR